MFRGVESVCVMRCGGGGGGVDLLAAAVASSNADKAPQQSHMASVCASGTHTGIDSLRVEGQHPGFDRTSTPAASRSQHHTRW